MVLSLLVGVPSAWANQDHLPDVVVSPRGEAPASPSNGFSLPATNGYTLNVIGVPESESELPLSIVALIAKARGAKVEYLVQGTVSEDAISAQIGTLGSVSMHFEPSGAIATYRQGCTHGLFARGRQGIWTGTVHFSGENGFTSASAIEASPTWPGSKVGCSWSSVGTSIGSGERGAFLSVEGLSSFHAIQNKGPGTPTQFEAIAHEQQPGLSIRSEVWTRGSAHAFTYDKKLQRASVRPPAPFSGSAKFHRKPGRQSGSWSGTLSASFPGLFVPLGLVGPQFYADLERGTYQRSH